MITIKTDDGLVFYTKEEWDSFVKVLNGYEIKPMHGPFKFPCVAFGTTLEYRINNMKCNVYQFFYDFTED